MTVDFVDSFRFYNDKLVLAFSSRLIVYSCVGSVLGAVLLEIEYTSTDLAYIDAKIYD